MAAPDPTIYVAKVQRILDLLESIDLHVAHLTAIRRTPTHLDPLDLIDLERILQHAIHVHSSLIQTHAVLVSIFDTLPT